MYALYIFRYISGRNVSTNVFSRHFRAKCVGFPASNATEMRSAAFGAHFPEEMRQLRAPGPGFRLISASGSRRMSQDALFRSFSDRFLNPIPAEAP